MDDQYTVIHEMDDYVCEHNITSNNIVLRNKSTNNVIHQYKSYIFPYKRKFYVQQFIKIDDHVWWTDEIKEYSDRIFVCMETGDVIKPFTNDYNYSWYKIMAFHKNLIMIDGAVPCSYSQPRIYDLKDLLINKIGEPSFKCVEYYKENDDVDHISSYTSYTSYTSSYTYNVGEELYDYYIDDYKYSFEENFGQIYLIVTRKTKLVARCVLMK